MKFLGTIWSAIGLSLAIFVAGICPAQAATVPWKKEKIHYSVESKPLKDVLRDFAASQGIAATIAPNVDGMVSGKFNMSPQAFLSALSSTFGFTWFYDGTLLDISAASDVKSMLISMQYGSMEDLRSALDRIGLSDKRFPIVYDDVQHTAMVSGPAHYVQLVSNVARNVDGNAGKDAGTQVRIFKLRHSSATDRIVTVGGNTVSVPGVASVLQSLFSNSRSSAQTLLSPSIVRANSMLDVDGRMPNGSASFGNGGLLPPLPPGYTTGGNLGSVPVNDQVNQLFPGTPSLPGMGAAAGGMAGTLMGPTGRVVTNPTDNLLPVIKADARTNSILVRDVPSRMSQYKPLIDELDVKPRLIEIQATMIEIDSGALDQIGVDWRAHNSHGDIQTGDGNRQQNAYNGNIDPKFGTLPSTGAAIPGGALLATPAGISMTAVLGDAGRYLMARVNALTQTNQARIEASPKVTTLDNIEAVMDNSQQMFVPVNGYAGGNLYNISTGVSLRVLPMVVEEEGATQIKLEVNIENGQFTPSLTSSSPNQTAGTIPMVSSSQIKTQAFITQGQSLLIAGYQKKQDEKGVSGIPLLSKIPFLGALFRYKNDTSTRKEQLFLLSPRVIDL